MAQAPKLSALGTEVIAKAIGKVAEMRGHVAPLRYLFAERPPAANVELSAMEATLEELAITVEELERQREQHAPMLVELEEEVARYRALFDASHDGAAESDLRGSIGVANARLAALLAVDPAFLAGRPLIAFVARRDCGAFRRLLRTAAYADDPSEALIQLRPRHGGEPLLVELRARRVRTPRGPRIAWSMRPCFEPTAPRRAGLAITALVRAAGEAIHVAAGGTRAESDVVMNAPVEEPDTVTPGEQRVAALLYSSLGGATSRARRIVGELARLVGAEDRADEAKPAP